MPLTDSRIRSLKRKAAQNSLEVEHLLKIAALGDASDVSLLRQLQVKHNWSYTGWEGRRRVVPFGRWVEVVCSYLEHGYNGLVAFANEGEDAAGFSIAVLEELKMSESVGTLVALGGNVLEQPSANPPFALKLAEAFNVLLSFKGAPQIEEATAARIRVFLHRLLGLELSEAERAGGVCALRGVGNAESVELITGLPSFRGSWSGLEVSVVQQINARLRGQPG